MLTYKYLYDTFSQYGEIRSCKISMNPDGSNKGFAYIQFVDKEGAQ